MHTRTLHLLALSGGFCIALLAACGGRVIVDGVAGEGGEGGIAQTSSVTTTTTTTTTSSTGGCELPAPVGFLQDCGSAAGSGPGGPQQCSSLFCDQGNNFYQVDCIGETCACAFLSSDGQSTSCTCSIGATCSFGTPNCCPFP